MTEEGRKVPQIGFGLGFNDVRNTARIPPPALGQHTRLVLQDWLGWDEAALDRKIDGSTLFDRGPA